MTLRWLQCALVGFALLFCASCGQDRSQPAEQTASSATTNPFRVAVLLTGPVSDDGWNASAQEGLLAIEREVGAQTAIVESLDKSKFEENFRQFAAQGYNLILGHAYEFQDAALQVAPEFPKTTFLIIAGNTSAANVGSVHFRLEDATYVLGALSAKISKTGRAGLVGGEEIPSLKPGFEGFIAGAKSMNPNFEVTTKYVGNWHDVATARELAEALIAQGADTIFQNADKAGLGVFQAAAAHPGVYAYGSNKNQNGVQPEVILASAVIDIPAAFVRLAKAVKAGEYVAKAESMGTKEGVVTVTGNRTLMSKLPPEVNAFVEDLRKKIENGEITALPTAS
jgi:basic membrane lipoprotein Med (substrate-binding protein (PBP1-ABC) superfamily)